MDDDDTAAGAEGFTTRWSETGVSESTCCCGQHGRLSLARRPCRGARLQICFLQTLLLYITAKAGVRVCKRRTGGRGQLGNNKY